MPVLVEADKKKNGVFYSPDQATKLLCDWAIRSPADKILEPSFGGCGFLSASISRLIALRADSPEKNIYGCDLDSTAFDHLDRLLGETNLPGHFIPGDFLAITPDAFDEDGFDAAVGNPPYVSHHNMSEDQKKSAKKVAEQNHAKYNKSSLWVYFIRHSLAFLNAGARMAWLLPGSFIYADYAAEIRELLRTKFGRCIALMLGERIFVTEGTEERTVVVLCDGYLQGNEGTFDFSYTADLSSLEVAIHAWEAGTWTGGDTSSRPNIPHLGEAASIYSTLLSEPSTVHLGGISHINIGIVTGANRFFVLNDSAAQTAALPKQSLQYIVAKFRDFEGLDLTQNDLLACRTADKRCLLVDSTEIDMLPALSDYFDSFPLEQRKTNKTFQKRAIWHKPNDGKIPDAFFPYLQSDGPSLLLNSARATSTNTIHRVYFEKEIDSTLRKAAAVSILSTFSQLSAEIEGRTYGSGVLKHEPSEALRIKLLMPSYKSRAVDKVFQRIDCLLKSGDRKGAQSAADAFVFSSYSKHELREITTSLTEALTACRCRRKRQERDNAVIVSKGPEVMNGK